MNNIFTVAMAEEDSKEMEKVWYDYNAALNISKELAKDKEVDFNLLEKYMKIVEERWCLSEKDKEKFGKQYAPENVDLGRYNYNFDFQNKTITYQEA